MIKGFGIYFTLIPRLKGLEGLCKEAHPFWAALAQFDLIQVELVVLLIMDIPFPLHDLGFYKKIGWESLNYTCSPTIHLKVKKPKN